jgi:hypothetical protein
MGTEVEERLEINPESLRFSSLSTVVVERDSEE